MIKPTNEVQKAQEKAFSQFLAYTYLDNADKAKYGTLLTGLHTQTSLKNNQYPKTITEANNVLSNHRFDNAGKQQHHKPNQNSEKQRIIINYCILTGKCNVQNLRVIYIMQSVHHH